MKKYLRAVERHLKMPKSLRKRIIKDLESSVNSRLEAGQSKEEILKELGTPKQAAADISSQMQEYTFKKSPWRWGCFVLMIISILSFCFQGSLNLLASLFNFHANHTLGIIGGADGPTAIFITAPDGYFIQQMVIAAIVFVMAVLGFWALSHMKRK